VGLVGLAPGTALAAEGGRKARTTPDAVRTSDVPEGTHQLLQLVNQERAAVGAPPVALRDDLVSLAKGFSRKMAVERNLRHNTDFLSPASAARLGASRLGENVAVEPAIDIAHARLMESPGHRANILEPDFRLAGIAVARGDDGSLYVTEDFLAPAQETPEVRPAPAAHPPTSPRHRTLAHPSRATRRPQALPATTPAAPAPPAAATPAPAGPPTAPTPAAVPLEPVAYVRAMPSPGSPAEGRHDPVTFQLLVVGSALALTIRRVW
jgi:hypothetical protein